MSFWTIIILTLLFSAFASGCEIAFISLNKLRMELDRSQGSIPARIIWTFIKSPSRFIATMLVANNIALVIYGTVMAEDILNPELLRSILPDYIDSEGSILLAQTILSTIIILVFAEFLPKAIFRINPNGILKFLALPLQLVYFLLKPIVWIVLGIGRFILRHIFRIEIIEEKPVFGKVDLDFYIRDLTSKNSQVEEMDAEIRIFQNALDFKDVKVRECMVPRKEIIAIEADESIDSLRKLFVETELSRIMVYRENIDNIIGFVHSTEMFKRPEEIKQILLPVSIVPEVMAADELLKQFTNQHRSVAIVVDEFGGTAGLITLEDLIEEIFGEIQDEHDVPAGTEKKTGEDEYIFSGRLEIDYLNKKYDLDIPVHEEYETLGGFILHQHENIPETGEEIMIPPYAITVVRMKNNKIEQVRLKIVRD
jgi:CBS domain containing-hemolysin-like protein